MNIDIEEFKEYKIALVIESLLVALLGLFLMVFLAPLHHVEDLISLLVWTLTYSCMPLITAIKVGEKVPPEPAYLIGIKDNILFLFSLFYWINNKGLWENNKLIFTWKEVNDIYILRKWIEKKPRTHIGLNIFPLHMLFYSGSKTIPVGRLVIILNDGRSFEINNVIDPENLVNYIKNVYLKKS